MIQNNSLRLDTSILALLIMGGDMLVATADASSIFTASLFGSCINLFGGSSGSGCMSTTGSLGSIYSLAIIEREQFNTLLVVSSQINWRGATCFVINTISLYDNVIRALMHYDVSANPSVLWSSCKVNLSIFGLIVVFFGLIIGFILGLIVG